MEIIDFKPAEKRVMILQDAITERKTETEIIIHEKSPINTC